MGVTQWPYFAFLAPVGIERLIELRISSKNQKQLGERGIRKIAEPHYRWMVVLHIGVLLGAGLEVWLLHRPFLLWLAIPASAVFLLTTGLRFWVIRTMAGHWNVEVMDSTQLGVVTGGPYRWVRHPNYVAVVLEILSIPLIHTAWITAIVGTLANGWVLQKRLAVEERVLESSAVYRAAMSSKPRFIPRPF